MPTVTIHAGDNRSSLRRLIDRGVRVHSVVTDAPYGLVSVQKRFGKEGSAAARTEGNDGSFGRLSAGFMGKAWDGTGIERDPEFWRLIYDILLPGGYVFAFSGSRTGHWQACAMETAGFIMHPMHGWAFGSGFPKAHAADKAIDKMLGIKGGFVAEGDPVKRMILGADQHKDGSWIKDNGREYQPGSYVPGSPEAAQWEGWAYGTQAQKPALEPIYLGQKPFSEKTGAANLLEHGVGAINIDGCRVPTNGEKTGGSGNAKVGTAVYGDYAGNGGNTTPNIGRHPSNLILDGSPEVVAMFPTSSVTGKRSMKSKAATVEGTNWLMDNHESTEYTDSGSAARFFHQFPRYVCETCQDEGWIIEGEQTEMIQVACPDCMGSCNDELTTQPLFYHAKAGKLDRAGSAHPTVKPIALMQYLIRHITPPGGVVLDPFAGSGTTGVAAQKEGFDCILMEAEDEYVDFLMDRFGQNQINPLLSVYLSALGL